MSDFQSVKPTPPKRTQTTHITESDIKLRSQELGMMGKVFGSRENVPVFIAGCVTLAMVVLIGVTLFAPIQGDLSKWQVLQWLGGFLLAALGYLFGSISGGSRR